MQNTLENFNFYRLKNNYEFVANNQDLLFNLKNNTLYDYCEVTGEQTPIVKVRNSKELEEVLESLLLCERDI